MLPRVFAAGSLRPAFSHLLDATYTFANARDLARRIEQGEPADVLATPGDDHAQRLQARGLLEAPTQFAANRIVIAVRTGEPAPDLATARLAIEVAGIPLGDYTRALFAALKVTPTNVVAQEQLVDDVADRIIDRDADAGILYASDVAVRPELTAIAVDFPEIPLYVAVTPTAGEPARAWAKHLQSIDIWAL